MNKQIFIAQSPQKRADTYVAQIAGLSRSECVRLLENGEILINGKSASKKQQINIGDEIIISRRKMELTDIVPENIPLDIIYQDNDIAVINKPQGMVVHPAHGNLTGTLVHAILYHIKDLSGINGVMRPGIVHRLDKNTSGLIIIAKNDNAHNELAKQFKDRTCEKIYLALAEGVFKETEFKVENYIGRSKNNRKTMAVYKSEADGKFASTEFKVLQQFKDAALIECKLLTGRTHQIRVHLASINHPCLCDSEYGFKKSKYAHIGQMLHSYKLTILHPVTKEPMSFVAPIPEHMTILLNELQKG